ncbi:hypothetical protein FA09DRAFT_122409 [Tilletiopsis washingtonensis]|uniref:Uncharacterized protein n=1 Tax=Tilletiopsis washingtonensis TaxID=58919 RepID=A0A316ZKT2_9BASI|nr:hypothetical protein FA09DRAFT_122409 [Tilletiopsis washingtonensis]PWO00996.1 hypothetical protein FA09DRAFT_122409 [Tilletiopsis washingtonensis]
MGRSRASGGCQAATRVALRTWARGVSTSGRGTIPHLSASLSGAPLFAASLLWVLLHLRSHAAAVSKALASPPRLCLAELGAAPAFRLGRRRLPWAAAQQSGVLCAHVEKRHQGPGGARSRARDWPPFAAGNVRGVGHHCARTCDKVQGLRRTNRRPCADAAGGAIRTRRRRDAFRPGAPRRRRPAPLRRISELGLRPLPDSGVSKRLRRIAGG